MQTISIRAPNNVAPPFTLDTYELLAEYAKDGHIPPLEADYFLGAASAIVLASDALLMLTRAPSWDRCDADLILLALDVLGMHASLPAVVHAVFRFRRWLVDTERGSADGIDTLEMLAADLGVLGGGAPRPPTRAERRAAAADARKIARSRRH